MATKSVKKPAKSTKAPEAKRGQGGSVAPKARPHAKSEITRPTPSKKAASVKAPAKVTAVKKQHETATPKKTPAKSSTAAKTTLSSRAAWPFPTAAKP